MKIKIYQVDAFSDVLFGGNPASVCPLEEWLPDELMQNIAMENNQAETAFFVQTGDSFHIRWFTPYTEVDLCGHATLASAGVVFYENQNAGDKITFQSRSGPLQVMKEGDLLALDFPRDELNEIKETSGLMNCFDIKPSQIFKGKTDYIFIYDTESQVANMIPDLIQIAKLDARGVIITARGDTADFVLRFFAPQSGIPEDPATGSAMTSLVPVWSEVLQKNDLSANQLSKRKAYLFCSNRGNRIIIRGKIKLYLSGFIDL